MIRLRHHLDAAAHRIDEFLTDGQTEPGAAVLARGGAVGLGERRKQVTLNFFRHADAGVLNHDLHDQLAICARRPRADSEDDFAAFRELDRIAHQVGDDLPQPRRIGADQSGDCIVDGTGHFYILGGGLTGK
jgi:hypothetical protein